MWWMQWWKYPIVPVKSVNVRADLSEKYYKIFPSTETVLVLMLVAQVCCNLSMFDSEQLLQMKPISLLLRACTPQMWHILFTVFSLSYYSFSEQCCYWKEVAENFSDQTFCYFKLLEHFVTLNSCTIILIIVVVTTESCRKL
jgi:hypothetical protein